MEILGLILLVVITLSSIILGIAVLNSKSKSITNRLFFGISISILLWNVFGFLGNRSESDSLVLLYFRINYGAVALFLTLFYFFVKYFPVKSKHNYYLIDYMVAIFGTIIAIASPISNFVADSVTIGKNQKTIHLSSIGNIYFLFAFIITIYTIFLLFKKFKSLSLIDKSKTSYFLIGILLFAVFNLIFNIFIFYLIPMNYQLTQFGDFSAIFFLAFTAYAILKHRLFNIKVIATETTVIILSIGLAIEVFLSNTLVEGLYKALVWVLAAYGGYVLINSVKKEIKQKEELAELAECLEDANKKLEELDEAKDNFLSMASHELNTPIAAIEGYLSMIIEEGMTGKLNPKLKSYLTNVFNSSKRLAALVRDLLNVSRIESNRIHIIYSETQIEDLIKEAVAEVKIKADEVGHKLVFHKATHKLPKTWLDQPRILEVLINLLGNSIKYTDPGGKISIETHADDKKIIVAVTDNGRGIPKDKEDHVFEKFTQVNVMKDEVKGTGLGMFIAKNLVELHKGKIWYKSSTDAEDHGTTFYFSVPIIKEKPFDAFEGQGSVIQLK